MKPLLAMLLLLLPGGDREQAMKLYAEGKYQEAAAAFRAALAEQPDDAELQYNLALALWQAGDLPAAEQMAEQYAAHAGTPREDLHYGLLGAVRYDEARALEQQAASAPPPAAQAMPPAPPPDPGPSRRTSSFPPPATT